MIPHDPEERRAMIGEYLLGLLDAGAARRLAALGRQLITTLGRGS